MSAPVIQPWKPGGRLVQPLDDTKRVYSEEHRRLVAIGEDPPLRPPGREMPPVGGIRRTSWTADELLAFEFPALLWAVAGIIAAGLNLLVGAPKLGKSWFALNIAVAIACGAKALGLVDVEQGDVLYLALEDNPRRMQDRLRKVLGDAPAPRALTVTVECEPIGQGGLERIRAWLKTHPAARLIVIDVFVRMRGHDDPKADRYQADYLAMSTLKAIADEYGVAILVVHHTRKMTATDFIDTVSGTNGLAGAADAVLHLTRARNTKQAVLKLVGRDVQEAEFGMELDASLGLWTLLDAPAADLELTDERKRILAAVRAEEGLTPKLIADVTGLSHDVVKQLVRKMADAGQLDTDGAGHYLDPSSPRSPRSLEDTNQ